ncbi:MAG: ABC transporter permease [Xanthobacteraceae bacterium]
MAISDVESSRSAALAVKSGRRRTSRTGGTLAVALALLLLVPVVVLPLGFVVYGALQSPNAFGTFSFDFDLAAVTRVYTSGPFLRSLVGTLLMGGAIAALSVAIGTLYAWVICRTNIPMRRTLDAVVITPLFLSPFVGAFSWLLLASPRSGMLNSFVQTYIYDIVLFDISGLHGTIFVLTLYYIPYAYLFLKPAFLKMDASLEDASYIAGAGAWRTATRIVFPVLRPALAAAFLFIMILTTEIFSVPAVLGTSGLFVPLAVRVQRAVEVDPVNYALAAAVGTMVMLVCAIGLYFYRRATQEARRFVTVTGKATRPRRLDLGPARWVAAALCIGYGLVAVVLPYSGLIITSLSPYAITDVSRLQLSWVNFAAVLQSAAVRQAVYNTLVMSLTVATCCIALGVVLAFLATRSKAPGAKLLDYVATMPIAVPGVVFGVGVVWLLVRSPLYNTLWIMVLAFVVLYLPFCFRLASNALIQIDPALEEASAVNGASRSRTLARISAPLARSALLSGWTMAFIFSARELSAAIILYGPTTRVLSVMTWDYVNFGNMQSAAVVGVLQTAFLVAAVLVANLLFRVRLTEARA